MSAQPEFQSRPDQFNTGENNPERSWNVKEILNWTISHFEEKQNPTARLDTELLLAHVLGCQRLEIYLNFEQPLTLKERADFRHLVQERGRGVPVAYLLGVKHFWDLELNVGPGVLIPRPDTEILVETALDYIKEYRVENTNKHISIAELGLGSGAIGLALCSELKNLNYTGTEISPDALKWTRANLQKYDSLLEPRENQFRVLELNRLAEIPLEEPFDFIISNPPYIPHSDISSLQIDVRDFEPQMALDGGEDGLDIYRQLFQDSKTCLRTGGFLLLESGFDQHPALKNLCPEWLTLTGQNQDLQGHDRVICFKKI